MIKENIYPLDFLEKGRYIKIIRKSLPIELSNFNVEERPFQIFLILPNNEKIILNYDSNNHFQLNLTQCPSKRDIIFSSLREQLNLDECKKGKYTSKTWKLKSRRLSLELKKQLLEKFKNKLISTGATPEQYFVLKIKGKNELVHMKNGDLYLGLPSPIKLTDKIYEYIDEFIKKTREENIRKFKEIDVEKEEFEKFLQNNAGNELIKYIDKDVYNFLYGRDVWEIDDGLKIFSKIKDSNLKLNNFRVLVRSFSIAFEGFLIKYFLEIGLIDREAYQQDPRNAKIFDCLIKFRNYAEIVERTHKGLISKVFNVWNECRNNYLHSDAYSYSQVIDIKEAESKIINILTTMKELLEVLPNIKNENEFDVKK